MATSTPDLTTAVAQQVAIPEVAVVTSVEAHPGPPEISLASAEAHHWRRAAAYLDLENLMFPWLDVSGDVLVDRFESILEQISTIADVVVVTAVADYRLLRVLVGSAAVHGVRIIPTFPGPDAADRELLRRIDEVPRSVNAGVDRIRRPVLRSQDPTADGHRP